MWRRGRVQETSPGEPQWPIDVLWIPPLPRPLYVGTLMFPIEMCDLPLAGSHFWCPICDLPAPPPPPPPDMAVLPSMREGPFELASLLLSTWELGTLPLSYWSLLSSWVPLSPHYSLSSMAVASGSWATCCLPDKLPLFGSNLAVLPSP